MSNEITTYPTIELNKKIKLEHYFRREDFVVYKYNIKDNDGNVICEFARSNYPACCGINILNAFYARCTETFTTDDLKAFFEATKKHWRNKTQFVAVKAKIIEWTEDEKGDEIAEVVGFEENYDYSNFIEPLIKYTKAKLISEFINNNSGNKCYVYEFDGENV
jgi:hypothetical protein